MKILRKYFHLLFDFIKILSHLEKFPNRRIWRSFFHLRQNKDRLLFKFAKFLFHEQLIACFVIDFFYIIDF